SLGGDPTVGELLARVRETALAAYAHQDVPFEKLVEELAPERNLDRSPLAQVFFQHGTATSPPGELLPGVELRAGTVDPGVAKLDLSLDLEEGADGFLGHFEYNTDLFDASTIRRMIRRYGNLLAALAADSERRVWELPLLSEGETQQLLREWNDTTPTRAALSVDALIEARAARTPEAVALVGGREQLSYGELGARVHRLAHRLRALGVGAEERVGVCMERTPEMVVALLATLKAGGVYVPLDPDYPAERREFMLRDSGVEVLLTRGWQGQAAPEVVRTSIDQPDDAVDKRITACPCLPGQLAYVIYTSGSTGTPKGVAVSHDALVRHCETIRRELALTAADRVLVSASYSFDVALEQTLPALVAGARLVLAGRDLWLPAELADRLRELAITVADLPAAYWQQWVDELTDVAGDAGCLRLVSVGGDVMPAPAAGRWPLSGVRLVNAYGPTEATITATAFAVPPAAAGCGHRVPIGRPLAGRAVYVLDRRGRAVPAGVAGELHLGGLLARGYLARPVLTAERFVPDPLSGDPCARR
ncbi:MAG: amino acid adenylation domain-containing protein, partial [bacterium]|nr:amino acid adenylation domain-containing protein [bacterium]